MPKPVNKRSGKKKDEVHIKLGPAAQKLLSEKDFNELQRALSGKSPMPLRVKKTKPPQTTVQSAKHSAAPQSMQPQGKGQIESIRRIGMPSTPLSSNFRDCRK